MRKSSHDPVSIHVSEDIVPIAEFKAHLSRLVRELQGRSRPVVVTQNGRPAAVVLSPDEFDRLSYRARFVESVSEGLEDIEAGRVVTDTALARVLDERYGALPRSKVR